jgi:hypothetical protein
MAKTEAQKRAQKRWRQRNKGNAVYLERQARKKRLQRARARARARARTRATPTPTPENGGACTKTLRTYSRQIELLYQKMHGRDMPDGDDLSWLDDFETVVAWLREQAKPMDTVVNAAASILKRQNRLKTYRKYSELNVELSKAKRRKLEMNELEPKRNYIPKWPDIVARLGLEPEVDRAKALCSVYTLFAPRRVMDYQLMQLKFGKSGAANFNFNFNYLILGGGAQFVFNRYKTCKKYGQQIFDVPPALEKILRAYVRSNGTADGHFLFGGPQLISDFTKFTKRAFDKKVGVALTANDLRHSYISSVVFGPKLMSVADRRELAWKMAHSVGVQHIYAKKELAVTLTPKETL